MAIDLEELKNKLVTVESLSELHYHNIDTYAKQVDPHFSGFMITQGNSLFTGNAAFLDDVNAKALVLDYGVKLAFTENGLEIVFLDK